MNWYYYRLVNGRLIDDNGYDMNTNIPSFASEAEAEQYLIDQDIRASVR